MMVSDTDMRLEPESSGGMLTHLPTILWQRRWLIIIPAIVIALSAVAAAFLLPQTYVSTAVLLVESQNLLGPTTTNPANGDVIDRRIAKIREQILSRPDLVDLIQSHNLYDASSRSTPLSKIVEKMRAATELKAVNADITDAPVGKAASGSIAFSLSFEYAQAPEAQFVAQTFVNRLLALDASESQAQAQQNVRLLEDQQSTLQGQVTQIESQITQITGRNGAALANSGSLGMITLGGGDYESQIASLRRENAQLQAQSGSAATARDPGVVAAEAQLAAARARYSDDHPDVKLAERQLAAAKANATSFQANAVNQNVQNQIAANNQAIAQLSNARATTQSRAAAMAAAQARGPVVAQQVAQLQAKADQVRADLARITTSLLNARSVAKLTDEQQGDRLTLVDPPVTPDTPTKPNRPLFIAGGLLGGLAFGIALALAVEALQRPIRGAAALDRIFGVPPLGIIPIMSSKSSRRRRRKESSLLEEGLPR